MSNLSLLPPSLLRDMSLPSTPSTATTTLTQSMRCVSCSGRSSMHSSLRYASHLTSVLMTVDSTHAHASQIWKVEVHSITCTSFPQLSYTDGAGEANTNSRSHQQICTLCCKGESSGTSCVAIGGPIISWTFRRTIAIPLVHAQIRCTTSTGWSHNSVLC